MEHLYGPGTYIEPKPEKGGARMPGAVKTVEAQIHVKAHQLINKLVPGAAEESFVEKPTEKPPPADKGKGGMGRAAE